MEKQRLFSESKEDNSDNYNTNYWGLLFKKVKRKKRFELIDSRVKNCQYMIKNNKEKTTAKLPEWKVLLSIYCHDN
jgi:hypothetical protein